MALSLRYAARSEQGLTRSNNEDSAYAGPRLLALADGMGGHAAGEVASSLVIGELAPLDGAAEGEDVVGRLRECVQRANDALAQRMESDPAVNGMGTTLTALLFTGDAVALAHVGDSRAYLLRDGSFEQITRDDTFVQSLVEQGRLTPEEAWTHPQRAVVFRAITGGDVDPKIELRPVRPGDRYMICSDGLTDFVSHGDLAGAMAAPDPEACADRLVELALAADTRDNVTCIVADVVDGDGHPEDPLILGAAAEEGTVRL